MAMADPKTAENVIDTAITASGNTIINEKGFAAEFKTTLPRLEPNNTFKDSSEGALLMELMTSMSLGLQSEQKWR